MFLFFMYNFDYYRYQNTYKMTIRIQMLMITRCVKIPTKQLKTAMDSDMKSKTQYKCGNVLYALLMLK